MTFDLKYVIQNYFVLFYIILILSMVLFARARVCVYARACAPVCVAREIYQKSVKLYYNITFCYNIITFLFLCDKILGVYTRIGYS